MPELFDKKIKFKFNQDQIKRILLDLLCISGERVPKDVYDSDGNVAWDSGAKIRSELSDSYAEDFEIFLTFSEKDVKEFEDKLKEELESRTEANETELPDNVWTQNTPTGGCGRNCPVKDDETD